jgi:tetratricopeptide (TPR) repeat protein
MSRFVPFVVCVLAAMLIGCASSGSKTAEKATAAAGSTAQQAARTDPLYSLTLMRQGSVLLQQEQYDEALAKFNQAERIAPGNATVHNMIGICYLRMRSLDRALEAFNTSLELAPSYSDARNNRGTTYLALGQLRLAEVDFLAVLGDSTYPHRYQVYFNLGMTYYRQDQLGAAEENFRKAATAPFPVFEAFVALSDVLQDQGRVDEALELLEDAKLQFPDEIEATYQLGKLLMEMGRSDEARPYLEEVISKEPGSDRARLAAGMLDSA